MIVPIKVHFCIDSDGPLSVVLMVTRDRSVTSIDEMCMTQQLNSSGVLDVLDVMHRIVGISFDASRSNAIKQHRFKTHVHSYMPTEGDYELVTQMNEPGKRMSAKGIELRRTVSALEDITVKVKQLLTQKIEAVHMCCFQHYNYTAKKTRKC